MSWSDVLLSDICRPRQWPTISKKELLESGYPVFGANGKIGFYSEYNHEEPTILITCRGATCGAINVCEPRSYVTGNAMALDNLDTKKVCRDYLARALRRTRFDEVITGVAQPQITRQSLARLVVPLPPLPEQKRIARILDTADALRAKRRETIAQLDALVQSVFMEMFGSNHDEWAEAKVAELASNEKGSIRTGPFGSQLLHSEFVEKGIKVLGIDNVVSNSFREGEPRYITSEKYEQLHRYTVRPGDVLITIMGTCGRCAVVPDDIETAINTKHLCAITLDQKRCLPDYLRACFLWHPAAQDFLKRNAKGAIMAGLNMGIIKRLPVIVPPVHLQQHFVDALRSVYAQRERLRAHLDELDTLFASLQSRAFAGEL